MVRTAVPGADRSRARFGRLTRRQFLRSASGLALGASAAGLLAVSVTFWNWATQAKFYSLTAKGRKQLAAENSKWDRLTEAIARIMRPFGEEGEL